MIFLTINVTLFENYKICLKGNEFDKVRYFSAVKLEDRILQVLVGRPCYDCTILSACMAYCETCCKSFSVQTSFVF